MRVRVAFIGFGTIARGVAVGLRARSDDSGRQYVMAALCRRPDAALDDDVHRLTDYVDLLAWRPDIVIEAAGQPAVHQYVASCLKAGIVVVVTSVGALADEASRQQLFEAARAGKTRLIVPSGAVASLDYLNAIRHTPGAQVTYESRKPPAAWHDELAELGHDPARLDHEVVLYEGDAATAAQNYPKNLNVAATLALAGTGMAHTRVRVVADPAVSQNEHSIHVEGPLGHLRTRVVNQPSPDNPKTSWLVGQSVLATVLRHFDWVQLG